MNLREYLPKITNSRIDLDELGSLDLFVTWLYQRHLKQNLGGVYLQNLSIVFDTIQNGGWHADHFHDITHATRYVFETESVVSEILLDCNIKVISEHSTYYSPIDDFDSDDVEDDELTQLEKDGYGTVLEVDYGLLKLYTDFWDTRKDIEYRVINDTLFIAEFAHGRDDIYKIEKTQHNQIFAAFWEHVAQSTFTFVDDKYIYLGWTEDYEGYGEPLDLSELVSALHKNKYLEMNEYEVVQETIDDYINGSSSFNFFDELLKKITQTSEVIFWQNLFLEQPT